MKKVLVTGSSGFIGSHLKEALVARGYKVKPFDFVEGQDIRDFKMIKKAVKDVNVVFNLAGLLGTAELIESQVAQAVEVNVIGSVNVLEAARQYGVDVVQISKPNLWLNTYSITKKAAEDFVKMYFKEHEVKTWIVKWFNIFGPRQHYGLPQKLAATAIVKALKNEPIPVFGNGGQTADHFYVVDAVNAAIDIYECPKVIGLPVEVGSGKEMTVNAFVKQVVKLTRSSSKIHYLAMRRGEDEHTQVKADISLLRDVVGFKPQYKFTEALIKTINYYQKHLNEFK